jgi:hypothetical protein
VERRAFVRAWVRVLHLRLFRAGRCFLFGFSLGWGWLRLRASVGPFASLVCLRGLLLLLPRLPFAWRCVLGGSSHDKVHAAQVITAVFCQSTIEGAARDKAQFLGIETLACIANCRVCLGIQCLYILSVCINIIHIYICICILHYCIVSGFCCRCCTRSSSSSS